MLSAVLRTDGFPEKSHSRRTRRTITTEARRTPFSCGNALRSAQSNQDTWHPKPIIGRVRAEAESRGGRTTFVEKHAHNIDTHDRGTHPECVVPPSSFHPPEMVQQYDDHDVQQAHDRVFEQGRSVPEQRFPPGMAETQFREMIQTLKAMVGEDHVHTGESLLHFSDPFSPHTRNFPSAAVWCVNPCGSPIDGCHNTDPIRTARDQWKKSERFSRWRTASIFRCGRRRGARTSGWFACARRERSVIS